MLHALALGVLLSGAATSAPPALFTCVPRPDVNVPATPPPGAATLEAAPVGAVKPGGDRLQGTHDGDGVGLRDGAASRVCPAGQVPQPVARDGRKGMPGLEAAGRLEEGGSRIDAGSLYFYGDAYQYAQATGMAAQVSQHAPALAGGDYHTLAELAAQSGDGDQIVEVGWTVDQGVNGDLEPHLFVYHWVNGVPTCYNGCGFVQVSTTRFPGMKVETGGSSQTTYYAIEYLDGNWWIGYQGEWIGYFPGSLWNGTYTELGLAQWFGEVSASRLRTCTDMGSGAQSSSPDAAVMESLELLHPGGGSEPASITPNVTRPRYYDVTTTGDSSFRYGGPGGC